MKVQIKRKAIIVSSDGSDQVTFVDCEKPTKFDEIYQNVLETVNAGKLTLVEIAVNRALDR